MALVYHSRQHVHKSSDLDLGIPFAVVDELFSVLNLQIKLTENSLDS